MAERRREKGTGTLYQRADGSWAAAVTLPDGRRKYVYGQTDDAVRRRLRAMLGELARGRRAEPPRETVGHYLARWLRDVAAPRLDGGTLDRYAIEVRRLTRALGPLRLGALTPRHVQDVLDGLTADGLAPRSVRNCRAVLRVALNDARREGLILVNAAELARNPPIQRGRVTPLEPEEARAILAAFAGHPLDHLITLAMATGLRQGELLGLRWQDVDLDAATLTVRNQLQRREGAYVLKRPKTADSAAPVALAAPALETLRRQRAAQAEARLRCSGAWADNDLVFTGDHGQPLNGGSVTHRFQKQLRARGLPPLPFHGLRHGTATLLLGAGVPLRVIMDVLRHSQIEITANLYAHVGRGVNRGAMDQLGALMQPPRASEDTP